MNSRGLDIGGKLTYDTIARNAGESVAPELWPDHAWVPAISGRVNMCGSALLYKRTLVEDHPLGYFQPVKNNGETAIWTSNFNFTDRIGTSIFARYRTMTDDTTIRYILCFNNGYYLRTNSSWASTTLRLPDAVGTYIATTMSTNIFSGDFRTLCATENGSNMEFYSDGIQRGSVAFAGPSTINGVTFGNYRNDGNSFSENFIGIFSHMYIYARGLNSEQNMALSQDPLLPFRRRQIKSYFYPATFTPSRTKAATASKVIRTDKLTYDTIARSKEESAYPELWPDHAWVPALGCTGGVIPDIISSFDLILTAGVWHPSGLSTAGKAGATAMDNAREDAWSFTSKLQGSVVIRAKSDRTNSYDAPFGGSDANSGGPCFYTYWTNTNKFRFGIISNGGGGSIDSNAIVADYKYHTCMGSINGSSFYLHIDGVYDKSGNQPRTAQSGYSVNNTLAIGSQNTGGRPFTGNISCVLLYSRSVHTYGELLTADPLLPFRKRPLRSWFIPQQLSIRKFRASGQPNAITKAFYANLDEVVPKVDDDLGGTIETVKKV